MLRDFTGLRLRSKSPLRSGFTAWRTQPDSCSFPAGCRSASPVPKPRGLAVRSGPAHSTVHKIQNRSEHGGMIAQNQRTVFSSLPWPLSKRPLRSPNLLSRVHRSSIRPEEFDSEKSRRTGQRLCRRRRIQFARERSSGPARGLRSTCKAMPEPPAKLSSSYRPNQQMPCLRLVHDAFPPFRPCCVRNHKQSEYSLFTSLFTPTFGIRDYKPEGQLEPGFPCGQNCLDHPDIQLGLSYLSDLLAR